MAVWRSPIKHWIDMLETLIDLWDAIISMHWWTVHIQTLKKLEPSSSLYLTQEVDNQKDHLLLNLGGQFRNLFRAIFVQIWGEFLNSTSFRLIMHKSHVGATSKFLSAFLASLHLASRKQRSRSPPQWKLLPWTPIPLQ